MKKKKSKQKKKKLGISKRIIIDMFHFVAQSNYSFATHKLNYFIHIIMQSMFGNDKLWALIQERLLNYPNNTK